MFVSLLEQKPDAKLLDMGCGDGDFTLKLAEKIGTRSIYGVDAVAELVIKAKAKGIEAYQCDLNQKIPFGDDTFDVICACNVIEHLSNTDNFVKEIYRLLKADGYIVILTLNLAAFYHILYLMAGLQPPQASVSDEVIVGSWMPGQKGIISMNSEQEGPKHRRLFTLPALRGIFEHYGFQFEKTEGSGFYPFPIHIARLLCSIDKRHSGYIVIKARKE
jgi:ubiquinone/menaquinone biosynthesis C-methylase UbiE